MYQPCWLCNFSSWPSPWSCILRWVFPFPRLAMRRTTCGKARSASNSILHISCLCMTKTRSYEAISVKLGTFLSPSNDSIKGSKKWTSILLSAKVLQKDDWGASRISETLGLPLTPHTTPCGTTCPSGPRPAYQDEHAWRPLIFENGPFRIRVAAEQKVRVNWSAVSAHTNPTEKSAIAIGLGAGGIYNVINTKSVAWQKSANSLINEMFTAR